MSLTPAVEALVALSAAVAVGSEAQVDAALRAAAGATEALAVEEALLQSHLFLGYPAALNAFAGWRALTQREPGPEDDDRTSWADRGEEVCRRVYGGQYEGLRENVRRLHPAMERWMVEDGYGRVLGRPGLDLATRELCIVGILAVADVPKQLYSHLRGALNAGASEAEVARALEVAAELGSGEARARALDTWTAVRERAARTQ